MAKKFSKGGSSLYRHFDKDGKLLYIGVSVCALSRLAHHISLGVWYDRIARVEIEHFSSRPEALKAERIAIAKENPQYNGYRGNLDEEQSSLKRRQTIMGTATFEDIRRKLKELTAKESQTKIAKKIGISQPLLNQILHGERGERAVNDKVLKWLGYKPEPRYIEK